MKANRIARTTMLGFGLIALVLLLGRIGGQLTELQAAVDDINTEQIPEEDLWPLMPEGWSLEDQL